jgi:glycosyltransferase involved in cell wall biosynthesis
MLTIVIPYYKISFFETTLKSLSSQTNKNFKVVIGDDASPNNPLKLLEKYKDDFDFIYKRFDSNLGSMSLVNQWNRCLEINTLSQWTMILGDDDVLDPNVVQAFYDNILNFEENFHVIRYATYKINDSDEIISQKYENPKIESAIDFLFRETRSSLSEYIFKTEQVKKIGFKNFPLAWFSDVLAVLEFSDFNLIYSINGAVVKIRVSSESISGSSNNTKSKLNAAFQFYYYLLNLKSFYFSVAQQNILLDKLTRAYLNNKREFLNFFKISKLHLVTFKFNHYFSFLKSIFTT